MNRPSAVPAPPDAWMLRLDDVLVRADRLLARLESALPQPPVPPPWDAAPAFRWEKWQGRGQLVAVPQTHRIALTDLIGVDAQKTRLLANLQQFLAGHTANNMLLTGARGTGKSSLIKAALTAFADKGLRLIEVERNDLTDLPQIIALIAPRPERFLLFCDDLSFEANEPGYKALKSALDGSVAAAPDNLLIAATSNRRHLMPERMAENLETQRGEHGEIHPGETTEEKVSLSERFGLWLSFYPIDQEGYLAICAHWLARFGVPPAEIAATREEALQWALQRGGRSGRIAWHYARDAAGRRATTPPGR